ncbi:MAG: aerobic carbon-monoxide dehydrogenase small subunit [Chloroflexia bacterium]|jgi:xanthine dehydrogenase YagT iron-sulfur-binding subunit|nr:aerobic carbon-monoxide dehydrogenase small subunit [Chloroflexia bacterium]
MRPTQQGSDVTPVAGTTTRNIQLTVNGKDYSVEVSPRRTLLDLLRDQLALTGTKKVCDMGHCGACTVLRDGTAVLSCLTLATACDGVSIVTVEGLAAPDGTLSPLQQAFIDCDGFQCGFCTPGQLVSATALLAENPTPSREEIKAYMAGNLCRCGAYSGIVDAIEQASRQG